MSVPNITEFADRPVQEMTVFQFIIIQYAMAGRSNQQAIGMAVDLVNDIYNNEYSEDERLAAIAKTS